MEASPKLRALVDLNAPFWAGEAEVVRSYWSWAERSRETDRAWLAYQCFKEMWGSSVGYGRGLFMEPLKKMEPMFPKIDTEVDRHKVLDLAETLHSEFAHYVAFADAYDAMRAPGEPKLIPAALTSWPAEDRLGTLRHEHRQRHGEIGWRAGQFTEGGYCTLFAEGMKLAGNGGRDALIAAACARVYEDEFDHMLKGVVGLDDETMSAADWDLLGALTVAQLKLRIEMRNEQFGHPLGQARIEAIQRGEIEPLAFDWARAQIAA
jgi:hypothetical protein